MSSAPAAVASSTWSRDREREGRRLAHPAQLDGVVLAALGGGVLGQVRHARRAGRRARPSSSRSSSSPAAELLAEALGLGLLGRAVAAGAAGLADALADAGALGAGGLDGRAQGAGLPRRPSSSSATPPSAPRRARLAADALALGADHLEIEHQTLVGRDPVRRPRRSPARTDVEVVAEDEGAAQAGDLEDPAQAPVGADQAELPLARARAVEQAHQGAEARRVEQGDVGQVDHQRRGRRVDALEVRAEARHRVDVELAAEDHEGDPVAGLGRDVQAHGGDATHDPGAAHTRPRASWSCATGCSRRRR